MDWDQLADELEEIGATPDRHYRMGEYRRLLAVLSAGEEGWAEVLTCLADDLTSEGQLDEARAMYEDAIADGGRTVLDPHIGLVSVEIQAGATERVDELLALLLARSRADKLGISEHEWIAETLEEAGRLRESLRWYTIPLRDIQPGDVTMMPIVCLNGRWRVRRALDLPLDAYDDAHEMWHSANDQSI